MSTYPILWSDAETDFLSFDGTDELTYADPGRRFGTAGLLDNRSGWLSPSSRIRIGGSGGFIRRPRR